MAAILALLIVLLLFGGIPVLHLVWWLAVIALIVWLAGFALRPNRPGRWYWW